MDKLDQLFIRACKSGQPEQRVLSVYRRFYVQQSVPEVYTHLAQIMARICQEYELTNVLDLVTELDRGNTWYFNLDEDVDCSHLCMRILMNKIRFAKTSKFKNYTPPAMFRN